MHLRRPWDQLARFTLLARFLDKSRLLLADALDPEFAKVFGHPLATDGAFLHHFNLDLDAAKDAVRAGGDDDAAVAAWFLRQPGATAERIAAWNELGFDLGKTGKPMERSFRYARRVYYGAAGASETEVDSVFSGIAWDEGYLEEMPRR